MIYPNDFERKVGFDQIRIKLKQFCLSRMGEDYVDKIRFNSNHELILKLLIQVHEFSGILRFSESFPSHDYFDLRPEFSRIRINGTIIELAALFDLKASLVTITDILFFFKKAEPEQFPTLKELGANLYLDKGILQRIDAIVDERGKIKDGASKKLKEIRTELRKKQGQIDRKIIQSLNHAKSEGWTATDVEPTLRNNRLVIPVQATHKRKLKGFIHDESATGQTVYIEPAEIFDANNEIRDLENAEKREILKILLEFTDFLRLHLEDLRLVYQYLGLIDFIRAKAKLAIEIEAQMPVFINTQIINWVKARHPILFISHNAQKKKVVPLDIQLDKNQRILIISGPNAGGKSVCLKTVGLTQYMLQCGLLPSLDESSETGIFDNLFINIGDEQSLENDLSTYSSHLLNIKHFILNSNEKTLFLIDEFGTGTEPQLGGAIAEAALEKLNENKSFGVITTHYSNLKLLADSQEGIVNGAMLFDTTQMQPLYQLRIGRPGSSFAFEIAKNIGFPKVVLQNAANKTGKTQLDFDQQLQQLEVDKLSLQRKEEEINVADGFLAEMVSKYENLLEEIQNSKKEIISKARTEALQLIENSNQLIERTIKEIKESHADKEKTKELREKIKQKSEELKKNSLKSVSKKNEKVINLDQGEDEPFDKIIKLGDSVKIKDQDTIGEVTEIKDDEAVISFNSIKFRTPLDRLQKVSKKKARQETRTTKSSYSGVINELNDKMASFNLSIDVRGKRADEALSEVSRYIDEAILLSVKEVYVLHGKGDGILRKIIREYLNTVDQVKNCRDQNLERGGNGITVVELR
ncbi:MAG: endonuclease MutS2 [Bacteroidetes bacterium HGW-Bacteroidetes-17]|nr:MAG: endonuclease MutS2 [Bacteroidetes bacterium HGW-Bacteroidetes-17]